MPSSKNSHITQADRCHIEAQLKLGTPLAEIARQLSVHKSTVSREIKKHVQSIPAKTRSGNGYKGAYDCAYLSECGSHTTFCREFSNCHKRKPAPCAVRDKRGFCNGCPGMSTRKCKLAKKIYSASEAQLEYESLRSASREGINLTHEEFRDLAVYVTNGVKNGQSLTAITLNHPECPVTPRTLYNYVTDREFSAHGVLDMDLPEKTRRKPSKAWKLKNGLKPKKRKDNRYIIGRTFDDFNQYVKANPLKTVWEMDTVYNHPAGPYIQTFLIRGNPGLFLAVYQKHKTAEAMYQGLKMIRDRVGDQAFKKIFPIILTDRGTEFAYAERMESLGCKVFYCDPLQSTQKAKVENKHTILRRIVPNEMDLNDLGLSSQAAVDLICSHINCYPLESLNGKTPYDFFSFLHGEEILTLLKISHIDPDDVRLKPDLLKKVKK